MRKMQLKIFLLNIIVIFVVVGCSPNYSVDLDRFRFHILEVEEFSNVTDLEGKKHYPKDGFVFVVVSIAIENRADSPSYTGLYSDWGFALIGETPGGEFEYKEDVRLTSQYTADFEYGPIPPKFRVKFHRIFEVARIADNFKLRIDKYKKGLLLTSTKTATIGKITVDLVNDLPMPYDQINIENFSDLNEDIFFDEGVLKIISIERNDTNLVLRVMVTNSSGFTWERNNLALRLSVIAGDGTMSSDRGGINPSDQNISVPPGSTKLVEYIYRPNPITSNPLPVSFDESLLVVHRNDIYTIFDLSFIK